MEVFQRSQKPLNVCVLLASLFVNSIFAQMDSNAARTEEGSFKWRRACVPFASEVLRKMKTEIEPCDDFYQFACGNVIDETAANAAQANTNPYVKLLNVYKKQLVDILGEESSETEPKYFKLPNNLFKACMNTTLIEDLGAQPVREISVSLGGWPVVVGRSWNSKNRGSWQDLAKKLTLIGFGPEYIFTFSVVEDPKNSTRHIIKLGLPTLVFESNFYDVFGEVYYDFMVDMAIRFGAKKVAAKKELRKVLNFEKALARICKRENNENDLYHLGSIKELQQSHPFVQWLDLINVILPKNIQVDEDEKINLSVPSFFDSLRKVMAGADKRTLANYMMWKFHHFSASFLSKGFRRKLFQFDSNIQGVPLQENRLQECVNIVLNSLPVAVANLYKRKHFKQAPKNAVAEIFENVRHVFSRKLDNSQWLDGVTKEEAKRKLNSLKAIFGFPDEFYDQNKLEEHYRDLEIDPNKYFQSYLHIRAFILKDEYGKLRLPVGERDWLINADPTVTSARCIPKLNTIYIPPHSFQDPFVNTEHPKYMNYAYVGTTIGHEITHGFYGRGCHFDADCKQSTWWQPVSLQALSERAKCFVEQYGNFTDKQTGLKVDGLRTLDENIADNNGVKLAYLAYKQWVAEHGQEPRLARLKYTSLQMFWILVAQKWCVKFSTDTAQTLMNKGKHALNEFRVLGTLRNMRDFSRDFSCPENSPMNPVKKCEVW